jgi:hypothetical protein
MLVPAAAALVGVVVDVDVPVPADVGANAVCEPPVAADAEDDGPVVAAGVAGLFRISDPSVSIPPPPVKLTGRFARCDTL